MTRRHDGTLHVSRREFLALGGTGVLGVSWNVASWRRAPVQDSLPGTGPAGRLYDPSRAGRPMAPTRPQDNDAQIQAIEKRLKCTCGCTLDIYTCRTTDFNCPVNPELHRDIVARYESGHTAQEIIDDFVRRHGEAILMAPPKRGFNLAAYWLPGTLLVTAGVLLALVLRRWVRAAAPVPSSAASEPPASAAELERLRRALDRLPT